MITIRSGIEKIVVIGRYKVSPFMLSCFIFMLILLVGRDRYNGEAG